MLALIAALVGTTAQVLAKVEPTAPNTLQDTGDDPSFPERIALFNYDNKADLNVKEIGVEQREGAKVRDIQFTPLPGKDPVKAYLVVPEGSGPFAGILWVHWLGESHSDRTQFLSQAVTLAQKGTASLLINAMWSDPAWYRSRKVDEDYANSIQQVIALRRALDLLLAQPSVDKSRIAFVGHDYGAMYGTIMGGVDQRAKAYVLIAATPSLSDWAFFATFPKSRAEYVKQNAVLELTDYLRQIKKASFLFQFARNDDYIPKARGGEFYNAAPQPKTLKAYDTDHSMSKPEVAADRTKWLVEQLGLN